MCSGFGSCEETVRSWVVVQNSAAQYVRNSCRCALLELEGQGRHDEVEDDGDEGQPQDAAAEALAGDVVLDLHEALESRGHAGIIAVLPGGCSGTRPGRPPGRSGAAGTMRAAMPPPAPPDDVDRPALALADVGRARRAPGLVVLEGFHAIKHAARFGADLLGVWTADPAALEELRARMAPDVRLAPTAVDAAALAAVVPRAQVVAVARRPVQADPDTVLADPARPRSSCSRTRATSATWAPASASRPRRARPGC